MIRHVCKLALLAVAMGALCGILNGGIVAGFHEAIEVSMEFAKAGSGIGRRGPITLVLLCSGVVGWILAKAKLRATGMVGLVVDVPFVLLSVAAALTVTRLVGLSAEPLSASALTTVCGALGFGLVGGFSWLMWLEEYC